MNRQKFLNASRLSSEEADHAFMAKLTKLPNRQENNQLLREEDKKTKLRIQNYLYRPLVPSKQILPQNMLLLKNEIKKNKLDSRNILYRPTLKRKVNTNKQLLRKELRKSKFTNNFLYVPHKSPKTHKAKGTKIP